MHTVHSRVNHENAPSAFAPRGIKAHHGCMNLRTIRERRGLTQTQLADMVGVNQSTINRAEKMDQTAKLATYVRCAEALGVSLADLFSDSRSAAELALIAAYRGASAEKRSILDGLVHLVETEPVRKG